MHRFAANVAAKARLANQKVGSRSAWNRNYFRYKVPKAFIYGVEDRALLLKGVEEVADTVRVTMGPKGGHVVIAKRSSDPRVIKNGVRIANYITFKDKLKNFGASFVQDVAKATHDVAGDGTTNAIILTHEIFTEACKSIAAGVNEMDLSHGITMAVDAVVKSLEDRARMISSYEEIAQVGAISANGDREIGELIAKAVEMVGEKGFITTQADEWTRYNKVEIGEGMKIMSGYISPSFITNPKNHKCELYNPVVLIHENEIKSLNNIAKMLALAVKRERSLFIVAKDFEGEVLKALIILNQIHTGIKFCAIKTPTCWEYEKLDDLAAFTGGSIIIDEDDIINIDDAGFDMLGSCKKATISGHDTVVEHVDGQAIIKIGVTHDLEVYEKHRLAKDALNATKTALEEGILPGGGVALLYASKELDKLQPANLDQKIGVQIIQKALKVPVHAIATNAGVDSAVVVDKLLGQDNPNIGYDAAKGEYVDMMKAGIIDSFKVIRTALEDAARVSYSLVTTEASVATGGCT